MGLESINWIKKDSFYFDVNGILPLETILPTICNRSILVTYKNLTFG